MKSFLNQIIASSNPNKAEFIEVLSELLPEYNIKTPTQIAHFFSQVMHESCDLTKLEESSNYSATRLLEVFPRHIKTLKEAEYYERNQNKIFDKVYANKNGNGGIETGDGSRFKGRGLLHLTGRNNYTQASQDLYGDLTLIQNATMVATNVKIACQTACWFWSKNANRLKEFIDTDGEWAVVQISRVVNGGNNGLEDRKQRFKHYKSIIEKDV